MKILLLDETHPILEDGLRNLGFEVTSDYHSPKDHIQQNIHKYQGVIIRSRFKLDAAFLKHATNLTFIGRFGAGLENIDVPVAEAMGITCIRVPEGNRNAVAEHALGMLLSLFNNLNRVSNQVRQGVWKRQPNTGIELQGKTVGVIGYGFMGSAFVEKLQSLGVKVLIYDKYKNQYAPDWALETTMPAIFEEADVLSLHVPLTSETKYLVNRDFLLQFKKPIYLINTARGPIVNTAHLVDAIENGKVRGACLDVLEYEKTSFENLFADQDIPPELTYLLESDQVVLSPHIAGWSQESFAKMAEVMVDKIARLGSK